MYKIIKKKVELRREGTGGITL